MWEHRSAEYTVHFVGLWVIRLRYKIDRVARDPEPASELSLRTKNIANRLEFVIYI